jgi:hypothetical protein
MTVERVLLIPDTPPDVEGNPVLEHDEMLRYFREVLAKDDRVILLRQRAGAQASDAPIDERDWLDSVNGGEGCWTSSDIDDVVSGAISSAVGGKLLQE